MLMAVGNHKLSKKVLIWNLPRLKTCPGAGDCKKWCYEIKIERIYKITEAFRTKNLKLSKQKNFVEIITTFLKKRKEPYVRIHEAGDFYNQTYFNKWKEICKQNPEKIFHCFTKSFHLNLWQDQPNNLIIIQSIGSKWDYKIDWAKLTSRVLEKNEKPHISEFMCPAKGCGDACLSCMQQQTQIHKVIYKH